MGYHKDFFYVKKIAYNECLIWDTQQNCATIGTLWAPAGGGYIRISSPRTPYSTGMQLCDPKGNCLEWDGRKHFDKMIAKIYKLKTEENFLKKVKK